MEHRMRRTYRRKIIQHQGNRQSAIGQSAIGNNEQAHISHMSAHYQVPTTLSRCRMVIPLPKRRLIHCCRWQPDVLLVRYMGSVPHCRLPFLNTIWPHHYYNNNNNNNNRRNWSDSCLADGIHQGMNILAWWRGNISVHYEAYSTSFARSDPAATAFQSKRCTTVTLHRYDIWAAIHGTNYWHNIHLSWLNTNSDW